MRRKQKHISHIISCSLIWKRFLFFSYTIFICQIKLFSFHHQHFRVFFEVHGDHHRKQRPWPSNIRFSKLFKNLFFFQNHKLCHCSQIFLFLFEKLSGSSMLMEGVARNFKLDFGFDQKIKKQNSHLNAYCAMLWLDIFRDFWCDFLNQFQLQFGGNFFVKSVFRQKTIKENRYREWQYWSIKRSQKFIFFLKGSSSSSKNMILIIIIIFILDSKGTM